jgi:hypothetical protein
MAPYTLSLRDPTGAEVEELQSDMVWDPSQREEYVANTDWNQTLERLYRAARRSALNIDTLVTSLLNEIRPKMLPDDDEPF